jgi:hypothetical protein
MKTIKTPLVAFAGMVLLGSALSAATAWTGNANDGDLFGTAGNWNASVLPGTGTATIGNGDTVDLSTNYATTIDGVTVTLNSTLNASADFTATGLTIQNTGTVNLTDGAFTLPKTSASNNGSGADGVLNINTGGTLNISGGDHIFNERSTINGIFRVTGSTSTIRLNQIGSASGTFDFVFDTAGVSTITGDLGFSWFSIGSASVTVNGSAVAGVAASYTLFDCDDDGGMMSEGDFTIAGLGTEGVDWNLVITDNPAGSLRDTVVLNVIPEPGTYALLGGLLALTYVMVRRRA